MSLSDQLHEKFQAENRERQMQAFAAEPVNLVKIMNAVNDLGSHISRLQTMIEAKGMDVTGRTEDALHDWNKKIDALQERVFEAFKGATPSALSQRLGSLEVDLKELAEQAAHVNTIKAVEKKFDDAIAHLGQRIVEELDELAKRHDNTANDIRSHHAANHDVEDIYLRLASIEQHLGIHKENPAVRAAAQRQCEETDVPPSPGADLPDSAPIPIPPGKVFVTTGGFLEVCPVCKNRREKFGCAAVNTDGGPKSLACGAPADSGWGKAIDKVLSEENAQLRKELAEIQAGFRHILRGKEVTDLREICHQAFNQFAPGRLSGKAAEFLNKLDSAILIWIK